MARNEATLWFADTPQIDMRDLGQAARHAMDGLGLSPTAIRTGRGTCLLLSGDTLQVRIAFAPGDAPHPRTPDAKGAALSVAVRARAGPGRQRQTGQGTPEGDLTLGLCYHLVRAAIGLARPDLIAWPHTGDVMAPEVFESADGACPDIAETPALPRARCRPRRVRRAIPATPPEANRPTRSGTPRDQPGAADRTLPPPAGPDADRRALLRVRAALYAPPPADAPAPAAALPHRLAIYGLNTVLCVAATPVGVSVLMMNALGKEDMRLTAQALAVTGLFLSLGLAGLYQPSDTVHALAGLLG